MGTRMLTDFLGTCSLLMLSMQFCQDYVSDVFSYNMILFFKIRSSVMAEFVPGVSCGQGMWLDGVLIIFLGCWWEGQ